MNKTKYEMAEMEIVVVDNTDVICTSGGIGSTGGELDDNSDLGFGENEDLD